jgi:hypothetical protein
MMTDCESGSCFFVGFHVELCGNSASNRTVFGNPDNSPQHGWENGVFFMYDPSISATDGVSSVGGGIPGYAIGMLMHCRCSSRACRCHRWHGYQKAEDEEGPVERQRG